ncbi:MAG: phosphatase PAP2 family protein [Verrucomicrobiales bacterium]|nr:phosphatase PAP2 family protein [Verrucomicrobiales bacterium]
MPDSTAHTTIRHPSFLRRLIRDLAEAPRGPVFSWSLVWVPILLLVGSTVVVRVFNLDLSFQKWIYEAGDQSWALGQTPFWAALYHYGTIPALVLTLGALAGYGISWSRKRVKPWRRVFIFVVLVSIVGPGLVTNLALKENWGRPRPREVEGLGGHNLFEPVLTIDRDSDGKSFPCGHATMGFLFMGGYFLFRRHRRGLAVGFLAGGFAAGMLTGIARMMQGGHFLSDTIWAGAICYFVPMGLYYGLSLHRGVTKETDLFSSTPVWIRLVVGFVGLSLFAAAMLATPFNESRDYFIVAEKAKTGPVRVELLLELGDIDIFGGAEFSIKGSAYGHGVPTSKLAAIYEEKIDRNIPVIWYMERISGWVAEVNQQLQIQLPEERIERLGIRSGEARIWMDLFESKSELTIHLIDGEAEIHLRPHEIPFEVIGATERNFVGDASLDQTDAGETNIRVFLEEGFQGRLILESPERFPDRQAPAE